MKTSNKKYEITDIAHETYPFLHRIRALRDIGENVKAGDLGGFVEGEHNLETELSDSAWIFDDAIACGSAYVNQDSSLHNTAIACDHAYVSCGSALYGQARAEDDAYLRGAVMCGNAYASGFAQIICGPDKFKPPILPSFTSAVTRAVPTSTFRRPWASPPSTPRPMGRQRGAPVPTPPTSR